jgi:hypothetical protein
LAENPSKVSSGKAIAVSPQSCHSGTISVAHVTEQCVGKPAEQSPEGMASQQGRTTSGRLKTSAVLHDPPDCAPARGTQAVSIRMQQRPSSTKNPRSAAFEAIERLLWVRLWFAVCGRFLGTKAASSTSFFAFHPSIIDRSTYFIQLYMY